MRILTRMITVCATQLVAVAATAAVALGPADQLVTTLSSRPGRVPEWPLDRMVAAVAGTLCLAAMAVFTLSMMLATIAAIGRARAPRAAARLDRITPPWVRRMAGWAVGLAVAPLPIAVTAVPAGAVQDVTPCPSTAHAASSPGSGCHGPRVGSASLAGLALPDLPVGSAPAPRSDSASVLVRPGDCLWGIAAARLGPAASLEQVAEATYRLYRLNRPVIGADPDLIRPGIRLRLERVIR